MIDAILGNKTCILILRFLIRFENQFFYIEEIARETGAGLRNVYDAVFVLQHEGMVNAEGFSKKKIKFQVDSKIKENIASLFREEQKRLFIRNNAIYKVLSEIESKIMKHLKLNLMDILLFGSVAKGRDSKNSDIDICVIMQEHHKAAEQKIMKEIREKYDQVVQLHFFTTDEFFEARKNNNPLVENILRDGLSLKCGK